MKVELHTLSGRVVKVAQYPTTKLHFKQIFSFLYKSHESSHNKFIFVEIQF